GHHQKPDVDIGFVDAIGVQDQPGQDGDQPAAIDLCDLIGCTGAGGAIASGEIFRIEGRYRAIAEAEDEPETDDLGDRRQQKAAGVDQVEIRYGEDQEHDRRDQQDRPTIDYIGEQRADDHE